MGNVGAGVYKHLTGNRALLRERLGFDLSVNKIAVRDLAKDRGVPVPAELLTTDATSLLDDPAIQIVVELMGQKEESLRLMLGAIERKKIVVTGNKALLAEHGKEIFEAAFMHKVPVFFEAAVAGGIPIIKALREGFVANHIQSDPRHHQRHLQLHPDAHDGRREWVCRRAHGRAGQGLRRSRSDARCGRLGHRAQGRHPRVARVRILGAGGPDSRRRHRAGDG